MGLVRLCGCAGSPEPYLLCFLISIKILQDVSFLYSGLCILVLIRNMARSRGGERGQGVRHPSGTLQVVSSFIRKTDVEPLWEAILGLMAS